MIPQGLEESRTALLQLFGELLRPHRDDLQEFLQSDTTKTLRRDDRLLWDIVHPCIEVWETHDAMGDIATYLRRNPYSGLGVPRTRYLLFLIGAHLQELYILHERLDVLTKIVLKKYRRDTTDQRERFRRISEIIVLQPFQVLKVRGRHVHKKRFNDPALQHLTSLEFLSEASLDPVFRRVVAEDFPWMYRRSRKEWQTTVQGNNLAVKGLLDQYFTAFSALVFTSSEQIRRPAHWPDA